MYILYTLNKEYSIYVILQTVISKFYLIRYKYNIIYLNL